MSKARLIITAVTIEKRPVSEVARTYGVARSWIYTLLTRYAAEGEAAFEPRSRRPRTSPTAISDQAVELIIALRKELAGQGLDAGPHTIAWHLQHHHQIRVSAATISRYLTRQTLQKWLRAQTQAATLAELQPARRLHRALQHPPPAPVPGPPLATRRRLRRPAQSRPRQPRRRHPRPRPRRHHRRHRHRHPPPRRQAPPHRHRPDPRPNPRPAAHPRPRHPHYQRRHRRAPPPAHPRPGPQLPAHRTANRTHTRHTPQTQEPRTLTWVRGVLDVSRHHRRRVWDSNPR